MSDAGNYREIELVPLWTDDSPQAESNLHTTETTEERTERISAERAATLKDTVFDPEWKNPGLGLEVVSPDEKIELNLDDLTPLLGKYQTNAAFYAPTFVFPEMNLHTPTLAILDIAGKQYALTDWRTSSQFELLQIGSNQADPTRGLPVIISTYSFGKSSDKAIQAIQDPTLDKQSDAHDTGATIAFDPSMNRLTLQASAIKIGIMAHKDGLYVLPKDDLDKESIASIEESAATSEEIEDWQKAIDAIEKATLDLREKGEAKLSEWISAGTVSEEDAPKYQAEIDRLVARGPAKIRTYQDEEGNKFPQMYYATVDAYGNIWSEFEPAAHPVSTTNGPMPAGKRIGYRNPTLQ